MQILTRLKRYPYFLVGMGAFMFVIAGYVMGLNSQVTATLPKLQWQILTGISLIALIGFQWGLFFHKLSKNQQAVSRHQSLHRYSGIVFMIIFAFHADHVGYAWMMVLTIALLGLVLTGLFNRDILRYKQGWAYRSWLWLHIAFAAVLMPLIMVHSIVALYYE